MEKRDYLFEIQKFLDLVDNIEDEKLKKMIIYQALICRRLIKENLDEDNKKT